MSSMQTDDSDTAVESPASAPTQDSPFAFPRLELPPPPTFGRTDVAVPTEADAVVPLLDEPRQTWKAPFGPAVGPEAQYRAMVELVAARSAAAIDGPAAPAPVATADEGEAAPATPARQEIEAATPGIHVMPVLEPAPKLAPLPTSIVPVAILVVLAGFLVWASRMAFSPALLALSGLVVAQLAAAAAASPRGGRLPLVAGVPAVVLVALALKGAFAGFSDMAMVASLFVIAAAVPALFAFGVVQFVLRRRGDRASAADAALRDSWKLRVGAVMATLAAGVHARESFSATPDAIVTFGIVALVALTLLGVLRTSRASNVA